MSGPGSGKRVTDWFDLAVFTLLIFVAALAYAVESHRNGFVIFCVGLFCLWLSVTFRRRRTASTIYAVDKMDGMEFELFLAGFFKKRGYQTRRVGGSGGDFGADIIIEKKGIRIAVQAKNYVGNPVGNSAVQQAVAGASYYDCEQAMVVTNSNFTKAAKEQANGSNIEVTLWDRQVLRSALTKGR